MFNEVIINMLELIETRIAQIRDKAVDLFNEAHNYLDYVMRVPQVRTSLRFAAVDSGFTEIPYLGFRVSVINVAILINIDGKGRVMTMFEPILGIGDEELERIALNMEIKCALDVIRRNPVDLLLLDGAVLGRDGIGKVGIPVLAHVKDVRSNRYSQSIVDSSFKNYMLKALQVMEEPLIMHVIMESFRAVNGANDTLISRPYIVGKIGERDVLGFYVQYVPSTLPIYVEYLGDPSLIERVISYLAPLSRVPRLGYPAPLYVVDRVARINSDFRRMIRLIMEKLGGDVLSDLRGVYLKMGLNEYVKSS